MNVRMRALSLVVSAAALVATGCGNLTIRSWVNVVTDQSSGQLFQDPFTFTFEQLQGGFQGAISLDTTTLPGPVNGTIVVDDVRVMANTESILGVVCIWGDPNNPSHGTVNLDILNSKGSATLTLNLRATAALADFLQVDPTNVSQTATFPLNGVGIAQLLNAASTGSSDGLFQSTASFSGDATVIDLPATFTLDLAVSNTSTPPSFDPALLPKCAKHFAEQGTDVFYGVNSKGSYLLADKGDHPQPPTIIKLADLGAVPGNTLKIARVGTYDDITELKDGNATKVGAVFSATNVVKADNKQNRIPDAIDAGTDVTTSPFLRCLIFPLCTIVPTDIPQDFAVTNSPTVTIPAGAQYLIVAPIPDSGKWGDNSGFGLGVSLTVNPS
ncbi:MAG TPA: hypothetical protein VMR50_12490 [Myxococcota bacterium]|nr:hypothetical protein [Myxococcota bacterium]